MSKLDIENMSIQEAMAAIKKALQHRYPGCGMMYFCYSLEGANRTSSFGAFGDPKELDCCGTDIVLKNKPAADFVFDVNCNYIMSQTSQVMDTAQKKKLHDAVLDYAKSIGLNTNGIPYMSRTKQTDSEVNDLKNKVGDVEAIAARIKMLQDEIKCLERSLDPNAKIATLKALAKRMRRAGDIIGAHEKDMEAAEIQESIERKKAAAAQRLENLKLARAKKVELKKRREQAEKDRQKAQQFDPHRAAKAKMKKIKERQQERAASKKKASESKEWSNRPIRDVIASRL